ncbi:MAG: sulfotransferase [Planctomycetota bacterium]
MSDRPILILGVPRSGTTLLRTLLDAHPRIACGPETPWLAEHQRASVLGLVRFMRDDETGYCRSYGQDPSVVLAAARGFVHEVMAAYAKSRGKRRWAEKTPNNLLHLDELAGLLPEAQYVWITRAPLDVAHSTTSVPEHRKRVGSIYNEKLRLDRRVVTTSTPLAAMLRWASWNRRIERFLEGREHHTMTYERLVQDPAGELRRLCAHLGEDFDDATLRYEPGRHDLPSWEWGSADVAEHASISTSRIGVGWRELSSELRSGLAPIAALWSPDDVPAPAEVAPHEPTCPRTARSIGTQLRTLANGLGMDALDDDDEALGMQLLDAARRRGGNAPAAAALALRYAGVPVRCDGPCLGPALERLDLIEPDNDRVAAHASAAPPAAHARLASLDELRSEPFAGFMAVLNAFAAEHGLREFTTWSKIWEYPWLWWNAVRPLPLAGLRVVDLGSELSPMPWWLACRGARVTMIETTRGIEPRWTKLRDALRVPIDWHFTDDERIPIGDGEADLVTSLSVIEHQPDKKAALDEAARVLRPGGVLALSFDICEPDMDMAFPEWNGRALTMAQFERDIWRHPAFSPGCDIAWNTGDIPAYFEWHKTTAEHHTYVTGAAVLRRCEHPTG